MNVMIQNTSKAVSTTTNKPEFTLDVPTISSSAMLTTLSIGKWSENKEDKAATDQVNASYGATEAASKLTKALLGGRCAELQDVQRIESAARRAHKALTLPWDDQKQRVLVGTKIQQHVHDMSVHQEKHEDAVEILCSRYNQLVVDAQLTNGALYNPDDYPPVTQVRASFYFRVAHKPVPHSGHFMTDLHNESLAIAKESCDRDNALNLATMVEGLFKPVYEMLGNMSERLDFEDTGEIEEYYTKPTKANPNGVKRTRKVGVKVFNDTLVSNVLDVAQKLEDYNLANDPNIYTATRKIKAVLDVVTPDALRDDAALRKATKRGIDEVIASLPSLDM